MKNAYVVIFCIVAKSLFLLAASDPLISVPVAIDNGERRNLDIHDVNKIADAVTSFVSSHDLPADVIQPLINEVKNRATNAGLLREGGEQTSPPQTEHSVDVQITVPFTYTAGTDARIAAERFIERHGLQNSLELQNSLIEALSNKLRDEAAKSAQAKAQQQPTQPSTQQQQPPQQQQQAPPQERKPLFVVPMKIQNQQVNVELYDGDNVGDVAANVCEQLSLGNEMHKPIVDHLTKEIQRQQSS